ncbi:hypothetical protein JCM8097_000424 [Rhodosporidiobolus ruineniae]
MSSPYGTPPPPGGNLINGDPRSLPPGWIAERDQQSGVWYFVNTSVPNPQAVWEDPRPAYYANGGGSSPYGGQNQYAPPPAQGGSSPYPQQPVQQQGGQASSYYGQGVATQGQPSVGAPATGDMDKGLLSNLMGGKTNQQNHGQSSSGSSSPFNKTNLLAGAGGLAAGGIAYKLFENFKEHRHESHGGHHGGGHHGGGGGMFSPPPGGPPGGGMGGLFGGGGGGGGMFGGGGPGGRMFGGGGGPGGGFGGGFGGGGPPHHGGGHHGGHGGHHGGPPGGW